jgi:23S rRNA-intervening sequence protein
MYTTFFDYVLFGVFIFASMYKPAQSFRDLIVWPRAHEFVLRTYKLTKHFPRDEQFCLIYAKASQEIALGSYGPISNKNFLAIHQTAHPELLNS